MADPRSVLLPQPRPRPHWPVVFQMQVVRDGVVLFAIERQSPTPADLREMEYECRRLGATGEDSLRVVSRDSRLYSYLARINVVDDDVDVN